MKRKLTNARPSFVKFCFSENVTKSLYLAVGSAHAFMALIEMEPELKKYLELTKQKAEERIDELSNIVKETTQTLNEWDSGTENSVSELHRVRDEQVSTVVSIYCVHCLSTSQQTVF